MAGSLINRSQSTSSNDLSNSGNSRFSSSLSRFSLHKHHQSLNGNQNVFMGSSPKTKMPTRYPIGGNPPLMDSLREYSTSEETSVFSGSSNAYLKSMPPPPTKSSGLKYSIQVGKELSSIDKINDSQSRTLVVAGKNHLGLYQFDGDRTIRPIHDFVTGSAPNPKKTSNLRRPIKKISTISDVKAGFHNHKNYIAICGTSTSVSIYDLNKMSSIDNPLTTILSEHSRSINSVDFNMTQTNLLISGGQDGCIKIWDLRSCQGRKNKCDIGISGGSDSVRDVKWMPSYDFISHDSNGGVGGRGNKFASIHDSGLLLSFDLRQPNQVEKKINAHSGPGLCMHWHPQYDYIVTGGRDGKCCLWYIGDKSYGTGNNGNANGAPSLSSIVGGPLTPGYSINSAPTSMIAPELVINTAHPLSKLKCRPKAVRDVLSTLIATSPLGEDSDISIYSLSRAYIPRNVLVTSAPSSGFVWWDEDLIFGIDKQNTITGWEIEQEPKLLDNMHKSVVGWRDIEGDGLIFVDQEPGSYNVPSFEGSPSPGTIHKIPQSRMSTTTMNTLFGGTARHNSNASLLSHNTYHNQNSLPTERPVLMRSGTSLTSKTTVNQLVGSASSQSYSHYNSVVSANASLAGGLLEADNFESPKLISLDLPQIINSIRISKLQKQRHRRASYDLNVLKESPVEVFKFLSKELKFSYMQEKNYAKINESEEEDDQSQSIDDNDIKTQLMEKFGLSENNTWTNLIRTTTAHDNDSTVPELPTQSETEDTNTSTRIPCDSTDKNNELSATSDLEDNKQENGRTLKIKQRINHFIELVSMCDHNAETYLYVGDLMNFKLWIMMRNALLWDLKQIADTVTIESSLETSKERQFNPNFSPSTKKFRQDSMVSDYSSFSASEFGSSVDVHSRIRRESSLVSASSSNHAAVSNLKLQLEKQMNLKLGNSPSDAGANEQEPREDLDSASLKASLEELRIQNSNQNGESESAIEDDDDLNKQSDDVNAKLSGETGENHENSIPIAHTSQRRISFIDTFITNLRSPKPGSSEFDGEVTKISNSASTKRSSQPSFSSSFASFATKRHSSSSPNATKTGSINRPSKSFHLLGNEVDSIIENSADFPLKVLKPRTEFADFLGKERMKKHVSTPPWETSKLIKHIFQQAVETGNVLLTVNILLLFQTTYHVTTTLIVKNTLAEFINILHKYELFEIAADLLKYCPWDDILGAGTGQSSVRLFCDRCGKVMVNERSKEKYTEEWQRTGKKSIMEKFGYWYCDSCSKRNTLCVLCERPLKKLTVCVLNCGHEGHFECFHKWFMEEDMDVCPSGCINSLF